MPITLPRKIVIKHPSKYQCVSECITCAGACYFLGSLSGFVSIFTTIFAIMESPSTRAYTLTTGFLGLSYLLKLAYYCDKKLAFLINGLMAVGWTCVFVYAAVSLSLS